MTPHQIRLHRKTWLHWIRHTARHHWTRICWIWSAPKDHWIQIPTVNQTTETSFARSSNSVRKNQQMKSNRMRPKGACANVKRTIAMETVNAIAFTWHPPGIRFAMAVCDYGANGTMTHPMKMKTEMKDLKFVQTDQMSTMVALKAEMKATITMKLPKSTLTLKVTTPMKDIRSSKNDRQSTLVAATTVMKTKWTEMKYCKFKATHDVRHALDMVRRHYIAVFLDVFATVKDDHAHAWCGAVGTADAGARIECRRVLRTRCAIHACTMKMTVTIRTPSTSIVG